jgi:hypothetical protein
MITAQQFQAPSLSLAEYQLLLTTVNAVEAGVVDATVSMTYTKQTKTRPRLAGEHYIGMPGVSMESQTGTLSVIRRVDNKANRKAGVVGQVYLKIKSVTRANGVEAFGYTNVRPEGITAFVVLGLTPKAPAENLSEAQQAV